MTEHGNKIPIKGYSTFQPLKHCIVGRGADPESVAGPLKQIMLNTAEDLNNLVSTLEQMDVVCYRPTIESKQDRPPISPRDYFAVMGEKLFVGKAIAGYKEILKSIDRNAIKWYLNNDISSGNIVRCGNHVHWDISKNVHADTEKEILNWLKDNDYEVSITRHGWHMDGVYSILKPGLIVASRDLPELESIYPRWSIFYPEKQKEDRPVKHEWGGNYSESHYDVNILSVNEENCILANENKELFRFLEKNKINPILCKFRDKQFWDNGIHCVTQDLYREGIMEDYFE
jgi:hypothetical protein